MQGRCDKHQFEAAENICRTCGGEFCAECLVYSFGPKKPPYCIACALAAAGVRTTAGNRPVKAKKDIKKDTKARRKAERAAKKEGVPAVEIDWAVPNDPTEGMSESELMLPTHATAEAIPEIPPPPPPPAPPVATPTVEPGFAPTPAAAAEHLINSPDAFAPTPPPRTAAEPPQHLLRSGQPPLPPPPPHPPAPAAAPAAPVAPAPVAPAPVAPAPVAPAAPPAPVPAAPVAPAAAAPLNPRPAATPPPVQPPAGGADLFAPADPGTPGDALPPSSFGLDDSAFDRIAAPPQPPTKDDVEGRGHDVPANWPNAGS